MASTTTKCRFCGSELKEEISLVIGGKAYSCRYAPCTCRQAVDEAKREQEAFKAEEQRRRAGEWKAKLERADVPPKFRSATTERRDLVDAVLGGEGLYVQGSFGTGKTHLACAIALEAMRLGMSARFTSSQRIMADIRATFSTSETENAVLARLVRPMVLVIDDIGKDSPTEWAVAMLYRVVEERDLACKPTVYTSNYSKRELIDRLTVNGDTKTAEAIVSRLFGGTRKVELTGDDRRLR